MFHTRYAPMTPLPFKHARKEIPWYNHLETMVRLLPLRLATPAQVFLNQVEDIVCVFGLPFALIHITGQFDNVKVLRERILRRRCEDEGPPATESERKERDKKALEEAKQLAEQLLEDEEWAEPSSKFSNPQTETFAREKKKISLTLGL